MLSFDNKNGGAQDRLSGLGGKRAINSVISYVVAGGVNLKDPGVRHSN